MGRMNQLWKKIKGMFNKNKALPEGKAIPRDLPSDILEEQTEMNGHEKFVKEMQDKANEFNPALISKEDAIMKILEEKGLSEEFAKNPAAKEQITDIAKKMLAKAGIERITSDNLEEAKSAISYGGYHNHEKDENGNVYDQTHGSFEILDDGSLNYNEERKNNQYDVYRNTNSSKHFSIKDNSLLVDEKINATVQYTNESRQAIKDKTETKRGSEYNKDGIEMKKYYASRTFRDNLSTNKYQEPLIDRDDAWEIERNSDLVTAYAKGYEYENRINPFNHNVNWRGANIVLSTEVPERLASPVNFDYDRLGKVNKTYDNGFIEYAGFDATPEQKARVEKQNKQLDVIRNEAIKRSPALRKLAEEKGLIQEEAQEIE